MNCPKCGKKISILSMTHFGRGTIESANLTFPDIFDCKYCGVKLAMNKKRYWLRLIIAYLLGAISSFGLPMIIVRIFFPASDGVGFTVFLLLSSLFLIPFIVLYFSNPDIHRYEPHITKKAKNTGDFKF